MLGTMLALAFASATLPAKVPPFIIRWEQEAIGETSNDQLARPVVDDILIHFPEEGCGRLATTTGSAG